MDSGNDNGQQNEFNIDKMEYLQVFKIFDKNNQGEINIQDVYELISKIEANSNTTLGQEA